MTWAHRWDSRNPRMGLVVERAWCVFKELFISRKGHSVISPFSLARVYQSAALARLPWEQANEETKPTFCFRSCAISFILSLPCNKWKASATNGKHLIWCYSCHLVLLLSTLVLKSLQNTTHPKTKLLTKPMDGWMMDDGWMDAWMGGGGSILARSLPTRLRQYTSWRSVQRQCWNANRVKDWAMKQIQSRPVKDSWLVAAGSSFRSNKT